MKEEMIHPKVFRSRLQISKSLYKRYVRESIIRLDKDHPIGKTYKLEWYTNRDAVLKNSNDVTRYTPEAIQQRMQKRTSKVYAEQDTIFETQNGVDDSIDQMMEAEDPDDDDEFSETMSKREADAIKKLYDAKRAKLAFFKEAGVLIESARVMEEWEPIAISVKKSVLAVPDRTCQLCASMTDAHEIKIMLTTELTHALSRLHYELKVENGEVVKSDDSSSAKAGSEKEE